MADVEYKGVHVTGIKGSYLLVLFPLFASIIGGLWGGFELYKRYEDMEQQIQADVAPNTLAQDAETSQFSWSEFSVAYVDYLKRVNYRRKDYNEFYNQNLDKKKKMGSLILKVKGETIKDHAVIPMDMDISLTDIDMVINEVLGTIKVENVDVL